MPLGGQHLSIVLRPRRTARVYDAIDWSTPIDRCPAGSCARRKPRSYYTGCYEELTPDQRRRYNQLTGMLSNELIAMLETELLTAALRAIESAHRP